MSSNRLKYSTQDYEVLTVFNYSVSTA